MSVESHRVLIGACGWKHRAWIDEFYDEDLPADWQLGFYSNEFPVVYVPADHWLDVDELDEWTDDVADTFRFILEIPSDVINDPDHFATALTKAKTLGDFCLGLVFRLNQTLLDNIELFKAHLEQATTFVPVCIDKQGIAVTDEFNHLLLEKNISEVWYGDASAIEGLKRGGLALAHINADELDMNQLRQVVEGCLSVSTDNCISVLCLDGNPPSLEKMRNADIILNLL